jgi:hypothetical protein
MQTLPIRVHLPAAWLKEIGQIITFYSFYEYGLRRAIYLVLGINPKQGRIAVRELRGQEQVDMLANLLMLADIKPPTDLKTIERLTKSYNAERDRLAHCIWMFDARFPKSFYALNTRSTWKPEGVKIPRSIHPEGIYYSLDRLRLIRRIMRQLCEVATAIFKYVSRAVAKRQKEQTQQAVRKGRPASRKSRSTSHGVRRRLR